MSLPKVPSSKAKDLHDGVSSFERVSRLFKEIESFIENELADTPLLSASYEIPRMKSKRKRGPYLIKPLNKSKARKTLNDMEYDPVRMEWAGNAAALKNFAGVRPALISNKANNFRPNSDGMVWNAKEQKWEGNYEDLRAFGTQKPALIIHKNDGNVPKVINGMSFNPATMTWEGNSDDLLDFGTISDETTPKDDGFTVGTEFQLSPMLTRQFAECAAKHATETGGWWRDEKSREHLSVIRFMSIMRLVRDAKRAAYALEPSYMDIVPDDQNSGPKLKSPHAETEVDFDDVWDEVGPFDGTVKLKLPEASDLDQELSNFGTVSGRKLAIVDEDWDNDFSDDFKKVFPRKLSTHKPIPSFEPLSSPSPPLPSITPSSSSSSTSAAPTSSSSFNGTITKLGKGGAAEIKPFALLKADAPHRRSFHDLKAAKALPKVAWDEDEDEDGLEIPTEPLKLKLNRTPSIASNENNDEEKEDIGDDFGDDFGDDDFGDDNEDTSSIPPPEETQSSHAFVEDDVEEEDWNDVVLPPTSLGEPVTRRPQQPTYQPPEKEEWDDFDITPEKIELKLSQHKLQQHEQKTSSHKKHKGKAEEEELDGLDIPDGFQLRLKR